MGDDARSDLPAERRPGLRQFQDLIRRRVHHILLVSSLYDSFTLVEDGQLNEAILRQFLELNITHNPDLTRVSTGEAALEQARDRRFDLIITSLHVGDMDAAELARRVRAEKLGLPVILLAFDNRALTDFMSRGKLEHLDRIFLWQGDVRILLAIVKYLEDRENVDRDTGVLGVPVILVVEDNVRFYSSFLPMIYTELMKHTHGLVSEGLNMAQKMLRVRARPKVLLCTTYEEAWGYFSRFEDDVLGIISDIEFPRRGKLSRTAGVDLARRVRKSKPDIPMVLQSSRPENRSVAERVNARFLLKGSPGMLHDVRKILTESFGFGEFVFRLPDGSEIDRAHDLKSLVEKLATVSVESLVFHGERNHFSNWLKARTEFALAEQLRPRKISDFATLEDLRRDMIQSISQYRRERDRVIVADFDRERFDTNINITRIGGGSLGGKARGLAFINRVLNESDICERFPEIRISVPPSVVLGTDVFDQFIDTNDLRAFALDSTSDERIVERFMMATFPEEALRDLEAFLRVAMHPLAVRSSGLLEDSPYQPFAGIYTTYMLPNNSPDHETRLHQLVGAIKRVYASTFSRQAKEFLEVTPYRLEEEKMAVIIQKIVGGLHESRFYPDFAGVARSHNAYATEPLRPEDGVVAVALGMGKTVVDGSTCLRFCPKYPQNIVAFSSVDDVINNSQREFYALDVDVVPGNGGGRKEGAELRCLPLRYAEQDGTLSALGSTYSPDNDVIYDGVSRAGVRVVTFAPILKMNAFPLAPLIEELLRIGSEGTSGPVEIEFAVRIAGPPYEPPEFGFLQMRPLTVANEPDQLDIGHVRASRLVCRSSKVLGSGEVADVRDLVVVDFHRFERSKSREVAREVARFNGRLQKEGRPYVLIGVGRWGSSDSHLGIPVTWNQISGARVIVECGFRDFKVTPSQGTHFFQNLTSCNVGYFTVNPQAGDGFLDWDWLAAQPARAEAGCVRWVVLEEPLRVLMSGRKGEGVILKPGSGDDD